MDQLALTEKVTDDLIDNFIPLARTENVFDLFISALAGDYDKVHDIISYLESESGVDGAYQTMGLLASQATNLTALVLAGGDSKLVASDFSASPYVLRKLASSAKGVDKEKLNRINDVLLRADLQMKTTSVNPWLLVEAGAGLELENKNTPVNSGVFSSNLYRLFFSFLSSWFLCWSFFKRQFS